MALGSDPFDTRGSLLASLRAGARAVGERASDAWHALWQSAAETGSTVSVRLGALAKQLPYADRPLPAPVQKVWERSGAVRAVGPAIIDWFHRQPVVRSISKSLARRILISNLLGFVILFVGMLSLSLNSGWVINAKRDALLVQGQIIAAAIAGEVKVQSRHSILNPARAADDSEARIPFRDDGFAALELSLRPERVAPILRRLIEPTDTRARIYAKDGTLVVDSAKVLRSGQIGLFGEDKEHAAEPRTKNFWTRLQHWLIDREVQVYKEIGDANGRYYPEVREALQGRSQAMLLLNEKSEQIVSQAVPIKRLNTILGVLLLSTRPGEVDEILDAEREAIWPLAAVALLASILTSLLLARTVAEPMKRLSEAAGDVSRDINAHKTLPKYDDRRDEVGQMSKAFRNMTAALFRRIEGSERFAADVAHELKNPLTAASSTAQSLEYARTDEQRAQLVQQIQDELKRLNQLITDVSKASRLDAELARQSQSPVRLDEVLRSVVSIFEATVEDRGCRLELDIAAKPFADAFVVTGNDGRLAQVLTNLIDNAVSFSDSGNTVRVSSRRDGPDVEITVDDDGPGIDPDKLQTIFDRFYTYRPTALASRGNNSGLGLNISKEIIAAHGGRVWAENRYDRSRGETEESQRVGARFVVRLPGSEMAVRTRGSGAGNVQRSGR